MADIDNTNIKRVVQLIGKTNQFNLTTRRHSEADVRRMLADERAIGLAFRLCDKFGDYGVIGVVLAVPDSMDASVLLIDTFLMSCRVIGRTAEAFLMNRLIDRAKSKNYVTVKGIYVETPKNALVQDLFPKLGFGALEESGASRYYVQFVQKAAYYHTHIQDGNSSQ